MKRERVDVFPRLHHTNSTYRQILRFSSLDFLLENHFLKIYNLSIGAVLIQLFRQKLQKILNTISMFGYHSFKL